MIYVLSQISQGDAVREGGTRSHADHLNNSSSCLKFLPAVICCRLKLSFLVTLFPCDFLLNCRNVFN